jgi:hypothetical protein
MKNIVGFPVTKKIIISKKIGTLNSSDVGTNLFGFFCKEFHMSLLHNHFSHMVVFGPLQRQLKNNYLVSSLTTS